MDERIDAPPSAPRRDDDTFKSHTSHWGVFSARLRDGNLEVRPHPDDPDPNRIIENFPDALRHRARITQPMVRRGWLERGPGPDIQRGRDSFVPMSWSAVLDLLAAELSRVRDTKGPGAISAAHMVGRALAASIMRRVRSTAFSTPPWAVTSAR